MEKKDLIYVFVICNLYGRKKNICMCYCIDICIIFMEFSVFAFQWIMAFDSIAMRSARYSFCKHFQVNMKEKNSQ